MIIEIERRIETLPSEHEYLLIYELYRCNCSSTFAPLNFFEFWKNKNFLLDQNQRLLIFFFALILFIQLNWFESIMRWHSFDTITTLFYALKIFDFDLVFYFSLLFISLSILNCTWFFPPSSHGWGVDHGMNLFDDIFVFILNRSCMAV